MLYQIGGYYGQTIYDSILCFDLITETYLSSEQCGYSNLSQPMYGLGCTIINDTIVTVGGLDTLSTSSATEFSQTISICKYGSLCQQLPLLLDEGVLKTRVFTIDSCHIGVAGGTLKRDGSQIISDRIDIADICSMQWIQHLLLLLPLSEMAVFSTVDAIFCLYGGVPFNQTSNLSQLSNYAFVHHD